MKTLARLRRIFYSQFSFKPLSQRPNGISCFTRTRNDEWLFLSLRSVKAFADEVIVVDTVGDLKKQLAHLTHECHMDIKYRYIQPENPNSIFGTSRDFIRQTEIGVQESAYKWIFEWNADFVAVESAMRRLRTMLLRLGEKERRHYYFFLPFVNLAGDIYHTDVYKNDIVNPREAFLFRHSKDLTVGQGYLTDPGKIKVPKYYRPVWLKGVYYFHINTVKSAERILYRKYWNAWIEQVKERPDITLQDFVKSQITQDFGTTNIREAMRRWLLKKLGNLRHLRIGLEYYPEVIKENLDLFKKYELIKSGDEIISRRDIEDYELF